MIQSFIHKIEVSSKTVKLVIKDIPLYMENYGGDEELKHLTFEYSNIEYNKLIENIKLNMIEASLKIINTNIKSSQNLFENNDLREIVERIIENDLNWFSGVKLLDNLEKIINDI